MNGLLLFDRVIYEVIKRLSNKFDLEEINMKKLLIGVATAALVISVSGAVAFAAGGGRNFVDDDNDGVCDYYDSSNQSVDSYGNSICGNL